MTRCSFCLDDLENHCNNLQHPGGVERWICGTCVKWVETTEYLRFQADMQKRAAEELSEVERHATELATGVDERTDK